MKGTRFVCNKTGKRLAIGCFICVVAATVCFTAGVTLFPSTQMTPSGHAAAEEGGNSKSMASNFNGSLLDLGQTSPHGYEGKPDIPSRRLPISAFQRLPPGRHATQNGHNSNLSTDRNSTDAATPMRNLTVYKLTGQLLGDEQDSYATWDVAERDSDKSNESLLEQKVQAVPLQNHFKSNVPSGRPETLDTVATSRGLSAHTLKLAHRTANSRGHAVTTRLPDNIANASYALTASSVVKVRLAQQKVRELGMLTIQMDAKNGSQHLTAVTLQPMDGEAASTAATIDDRNAEPPLVNVSYLLTPASQLQLYANAETVSQSAWTPVSLIGGTTPRLTHDSTNEANDTETKQEVNVVRVQDDLIDIPEARADADVNDTPEDDLSVSTDITTTDKKAETHYIDAMTSASEAMTGSGVGKVTETIEVAADSPPMPETVTVMRAITSDVGSTDATTAVVTEDALSTQMPVTDETGGDVTGVISSEESHTQEASSSVPQMSVSSEQFTDVISSEQGPTKEPSSFMLETGVSNEQFTDVFSIEQGPTQELSSTVPEISVSSEEFTDVISSDQGPTQEPSSTIPEISVSSEEFTDLISSEQGPTQEPSSFIPEISVSSEEFTDVISSENSHTKDASASIPEMSVSSEEFTDVVSSEQSHTEEVSSSIPAVTGGNEEFTDVISSEESHTGEASFSVPEMSVSSEEFTDVLTNEQGPTQEVSSSIPEMTGSSQELTDAITSEKSPTGEASSSMPEMTGSSEEFTDLIMSSMETAASSMLVTDTSSDSQTEEISSEQSTAEMDWSLIPDTSEINDIFTEVIPSEEYSPQVALVTIPFTSESDDAFTELIRSEQPSAENASELETITSIDGATFTEAMSSEQQPVETVSVSIALTSRDGETLTDMVSTENAEDMISSVTLLTGEYNEEVSEVIGTDNSSSLAPTITGSDSITAFDLIDITLEIDNATNASSTEMTNGSSGAESTAILVTTGATDNFTDKTQGVDTSAVTASELITPVELITFTEDFSSTEENASSVLESTTMAATSGATDQLTISMEDLSSPAATDSEKITAADLFTFTEEDVLLSSLILVTSGETDQITNTMDGLNSSAVTDAEIITAAELITFTDEGSSTKMTRPPITPQPLVTVTDESSELPSEASTPEASSTVSTNATVSQDTTAAVDSTAIVVTTGETGKLTDTTGSRSSPATTASEGSSKTSDTTSGTPTRTTRPPLSGVIYCNTSFCEADGQFISGVVKGSSIDPCDNFHAYVCEQWSRASPDATTVYADAADALAGTTEETTRQILSGIKDADLHPLQKLWATCNQNASATKTMLVEVLSSLGIDLTDVQKASSEEALRAGGSVQFKLGVAPLAFVSMDSYVAKGYMKILALEDGDTLMSPEDAATSGQMESISTLACVYLQAVAPADQRSKTLCDSIADVALQLAKISLLDKSPKERMTNYSLETWDTVAPLEALFQAMNGSRSYMGDNKPVLLKNQRLVAVIKTLIQTMPEHVYRYVGFHATAYLSPYLDSMEAFWEMALFATARRVPRRKMPRERIGRMVDELSLDTAVGHWPPEKWRICLHVIDRLLPGVLVVAFSRNANDTTFFTELMADVIAEEVRSTFIDHVGRMAHFDNWTRRVFKMKAKTTNLYSMFPLRQFFHASVLEYAKKVQAKVQNANTSLDIFLKASAFVGSTWSDPKQDIMHENRFGSTLFDTDCLDWPQHDTVMIPMGMFNHSIPTSPSERMFHVPSIGYRLAACLFQETFPGLTRYEFLLVSEEPAISADIMSLLPRDCKLRLLRQLLTHTTLVTLSVNCEENFYNPFSIYWTREATAALKARQDCFAKQYRANDYRTSYVFTRIAENAALRVAYENYQQRLYPKRYLNKDYRLNHLNMTADQLFFVYYTLSYCSDYTQDSADKKIFVQERVNVPLMNMKEFATAFQCASKKPMNPSKRCLFWT